MVFGKNPGFLAFFNFHGGPNKMAQVNITGSLRATEKNKIKTGTSPKSAPVFFFPVYIGDYTTQLYRDYSNAIIRIPINQPGFNGK